jgi:hypothetical protein
MKKLRCACFLLLWCVSVILILFSLLSSEDISLRPYVCISFTIALAVSLLKKYENSPYWLFTCIVGVIVGLGSIVPLITIHRNMHTVQVSDTNSHQIGDWYLKMNPKENDPNSADMVDYTFQYVYIGDSKAKYKIQVGNATVEDKIGISFGEGGVVGSSFPKGVKQIKLQLSTSEGDGKNFEQTLLYRADK